MPTFRNTLTFVGQDGSTWNEVYYQDAGGIAQTGFSNPTISGRLGLLNHLNLLRVNRITQVDVPRVTRQTIYNLPGTGGASTTPPTPNTTAIVVSLSSLTGGSRKMWIRGGNATDVAKDPTTGRDAPPPNLLFRLAQWFTLLMGDGFGLRTLQGIVPGPLTPIKILKVDGSAANGTSLVTLAAAPGYPFPSRVLIGGASKKDLPSLNGQYSLLAAPAGAIVQIGYQTPGSGIVTGGKATMRQAIYNPTHVFTDSLCGFDHYGSHATRVANFRSRGARRAARLRPLL